MPQIPTLEAAPGQEGLVPYPQRKRVGLFLAFISILFVIGAGVAAAVWMLNGGLVITTKAALQPAPTPTKPALFVALDPPFVVNFEAEGLVRFLQVTVQVMSRDQATVDLIRANDPIVRNDLLLLLGNQTYESINNRDGKERLREQALETVRNVIANAGGKPDLVEAVYFTSFVMQ